MRQGGAALGTQDPAADDLTYDVVRQYDGWSDFPTYLWNPVAIANAIMGAIFVHGNAQLDLTAGDLESARASGDSDYYQFDAASNTHYYVLKTYPVPLLMSVAWLPDPIIAALDVPLRRFIELTYDRSDYSAPKRSTFFASLSAPIPAEPIAEEQSEAIAPDEHTAQDIETSELADEEPEATVVDQAGDSDEADTREESA